MRNVKVIGNSNKLTRGKSMGTFQGKDCQWNLFGYYLGSHPTFNKALMNGLSNKNIGLVDQFTENTFTNTSSLSNYKLKYLKGVSSHTENMHLILLSKKCVVATGVAYL